MFKTRTIVCYLFAALSPFSYAPLGYAANSDEIRSTLQDQQEVAVTIYNDNLALVKDQRKIKLKTGTSSLALRDVSAQIRPETALLRSLTAPAGLSVMEQNFDFDLLTPQKLLEKYVGKTVGLVRVNPATGAETTEQAQVLSANNGVVLKIGDRIETGVPGRITYSDVPANLRDRPTLVLQLQNKTASEQNVELSYLTGGLGWKADYVAELNANEDKLDLSGWVTLTNTSGTSYRNAKLQLVAGDVNRVHEPMRPAMMEQMRMKTMDMAASAPMSEEGLLEYHLYTLDHPTTIAESQTKQVALLSATGVPARKDLVLRGADYYYQSSYGDLGQKVKVGVYVEFDNKEASKLGMPLPKGIMRVYKKDSSGNAQFVGEDNIDHTPKNETVRLKLGEAFDVTADKKQTDFKRLPNPAKGNSLFESAYEIVIKNAKKERVTVTVQEPIPADWKITKESLPSVKATSNTAVWKVEVPAEGKTTLTYRVQVKY
ncbi:MAG: DUF4139 domain-containing protein [Candidatus Methylopumilus sp.]|jgi:hypothetical protein